MTKTVTWEEQKDLAQRGLAELLLGAAWEYVAMVLCLFSSLSMFTVISPSLRMQAGDAVRLALFILLVVFLGEVVLKWALGKMGEKLRKQANRLAILFSGLLLCFFLLRFYSAHGEEIRGGILAVFAHYVDAFNLYFKANLVIQGGMEEHLSMALGFCALLFFLPLFVLDYISESPQCFAILPLVSLSLAMYVGLVPGYAELGMAAMGIFMLFRKRKNKGWIRNGLLSLLILGGLLLLSGALFAKRAEGMLVLSQRAKAYQKKLEKNVDSLLSGAYLSQRKTVNNSRPRYLDAKIMTVRMQDQPEGNLYCKDFYGENYDGGKWQAAERDFRLACRENGISEGKATAYLAGTLFRGKQLAKTQYELRYFGILGSSMLLPYGANASQVKGLRFKGDSIAEKGVTRRSVTFEGLTKNALSEAELSGMLYGWDPDEEERSFWEWHGDYANESALKVPEYVFQTEGYRSLMNLPQSVSAYRAPQGSNEWRLALAESVRGWLITNCTYDWDLDGIEGGEDPIRYFLEEGRKGYCMHFASAGVLLLRSLGVPARYASGYVVKPASFERQEDGSYLAQVIDRNGHAWAEVYLDKIGWVPVEMTPGYEGNQAELPTSKAAQQERENQRVTREQESEVQESEEESEIASESEESEAESSQEESEPEETDPAEESSQEASSEESADPQEESLESGEEESLSSEEGYGGLLPGGAQGGRERKPVNWKLFGRIALGLGMLAAAFGLILAWRRAYRRQLENALSNKYYKAAVLLMNRRNYQRLKRRGKLKNGGTTDRDYEDGLIQFLGEEKRDTVEDYMRIVKVAAFSRRRITREECNAVLRLYRKLHAPRL